MMKFGKRLSWRLTGGLVAIALGALAAAQAQRQGMDDPALPQLDEPAWADSVPTPIQGETESSPAAAPPAAFAARIPSTDPEATSGDDPPWQEPAEDARGPSSELVAQVNHEEPIDNSAPAPVQHDQPMSMPQPEEMPQPMAFNPMDAMPPPDESPPPAPADGPAMAMPMLAMPEAPPQQPVQEQAAPEQPVSEQAMQVPEMNPPPGPSEPAAMPEVPFDQAPAMNVGPMNQDGPSIHAEPMSEESPAMNPGSMSHDGPTMNGGPAMDAEPMSNAGSLRDAGPAMSPNAQPMPSMPPREMPQQEMPSSYGGPATQGLGTPSDPPAAQNDGQNSLRESANMENQLRPQASAGTQQQMPLPALPEPNGYRDNAASPSMNPAPASRQQTPAQFAGYAPDPYLANGGQPISISSPGDRRLEGVQTPSVVIHKRAPAEVKVGRPATFIIEVKNVGSAEALGVLVHDRVPAGMQLVDAKPEPRMQDDLLVWQLGAMPVGDERSITLQLVPQEEGELGSVARVTFEAAASVRTRSTRPELKITQRAPQKVLIGQQLEIELEVANVGTGAATSVILQADVPPGLNHPRGRQLDNALGALRPGEVRREVLRMRAAEPGMIENVVHLVAEDAEPATHSVSVEVIAPKIDVALTGPSRRFLERQATYMVNIANHGSAPATNVEIIARLDRGLTFVSTENDGHYDPNMHAVRWSIVDLPPDQEAAVPVTLLPVEVGEQVIRLQASADLNARSETENTVAVESQAELNFSIADTADPIELGSETTYEIKVQNSGSRNDTNVQVQMLLPPGLEMLESDSDAGTDGRGGVLFAPTKNLPAGGELTYRVRVRGVQPETHVIQATVTSDQSRVPVTKEESTMVYADQ